MKSFEDFLKDKEPVVMIMAGSDSDSPHIEKITRELEHYEIPYQVRICSAHKEPSRLAQLISDYNLFSGPIVYIAVAGGVDALSGTLSFNSFYPVISCPPDAPNDTCLRNPSGSSNAYIPNPKNVVKFIAQMFSSIRPGLRNILMKDNMEKVRYLREADRKFGTG